MNKMKYEFEYFKEKGKEQIIEIEADNDKEAVMKLYDIVGICEFGCIKDGRIFSDEEFSKEKEMIIRGC